MLIYARIIHSGGGVLTTDATHEPEELDTLIAADLARIRFAGFQVLRVEVLSR